MALVSSRTKYDFLQKKQRRFKFNSSNQPNRTINYHSLTRSLTHKHKHIQIHIQQTFTLCESTRVNSFGLSIVRSPKRMWPFNSCPFYFLHQNLNLIKQMGKNFAHLSERLSDPLSWNGITWTAFTKYAEKKTIYFCPFRYFTTMSIRNSRVPGGNQSSATRVEMLKYEVC